VGADGTVLEYCGYLGGEGTDYANSVVVNGTGHAFLVGATNGDLPVRVGPGTAPSGSYDAFVAKVAPGGDRLDYCGYIGGLFDDIGHDIALDDQGRAYVAGYTYSDEETFPVTVGPDLTFNHPVPGFTTDAFVARVRADGSQLDYCGYLGGLGWDAAFGVAVDAEGRAHLTGTTLSDERSFPVAIGPSLVYSGGSAIWGDAFAARVRADGTGLAYCGYIGGADGEGGLDIAVGPDGRAHITGITLSPDFPTTGDSATDDSFNGVSDAFVASIAPDGSGLDLSGFLGGARGDRGNGIGIDAAGNLYVGGETASDQATFPVLGGPDVTFNGGHPEEAEPTDGFVCKFVPIVDPEVTLRLEPRSSTVVPGETLLVDVTVTNGAGETRTVEGWLEIFKPHRASWRLNPIGGPRAVTLAPGESRRRTARLLIPEEAPPSGPYRIRGAVGTYPAFPRDVSEFEFEIVGP
jgi:hypothetical protein